MGQERVGQEGQVGRQGKRGRERRLREGREGVREVVKAAWRSAFCLLPVFLLKLCAENSKSQSVSP